MLVEIPAYCGQHHPLGEGPELDKGENQVEHKQVSLYIHFFLLLTMATM